MNKSFFIFIGILSISAAENHWNVEEEEEVGVLTSKNFDSFIAEHKYVFVKFYAPWCGHCKSMAPGYSNVAKRMKEEENGVPIVKVDATVETELAKRFEVQGFPTLKFFINGKPIDYKGAREEEDIFNWIQKKTGPSAILLNLSEIEKIEAENVSVIFILPSENQASLEDFNTLAASYEKIRFFYTHDESLKERYAADKEYVFVVYRNFDDGRKILMNSESPSLADMKTFVDSFRFPLIMDFDQEAAERIFGEEQSVAFFFSDNVQESLLVEHFKKVAEEYKKDLIFSISKISVDLGAKLCEFLGVTAENKDQVRLIRFVGGNLQKFKCPNNSIEELKNCVEDFKNNKLTPYFKSEQAPAENNDAVKVVVGDTFQKIVLDSDVHVLVEAYAPWCGHCKKLAPIYEELAKKIAILKDILIVKMDASANEHPSIEVKGFPTIKFFKKGSKDTPIDFEGERTLEGFLSFLTTQTGMKLDTGIPTPEL